MYKKQIKIILALALLFCIFDMPYWYYQLIRLFGAAGMAYLAYAAHTEKIKYFSVIFVVAALLLQPFYKISFPRDIWNLVDIILAIILLISLHENKFTTPQK